MRKHLASVLLALAPVVLFNTAFADEHRAKSAVNFAASAMLNGTTNTIGKTAIVVKIQSAAIAKDGTITARATIVDADGLPLDRLGITSKGPISMSFIAAYIPGGQTQYVSYTTTVAKATTNTNPNQIQAANDSGGVFTANAIGDYTYTFKTRAPVTFDPTATNAIGVSVTRDLSAFGTFDEWSETSNDVFTFVPDGSAVKVTRSVVTTDACNQCHNPLIGHGGSRLKVELCIMCHTPQTTNPDTLLTQDMKVLIHKIHDGANLPSVKAGTPYRVWHRGAWSDFSTVVFPHDVRNCTTCHAAGATQADAWKTKPSSAVCGSCHDDVNFATGVNHPGGPQFDDNQCSGCHIFQGENDFDASIKGAHIAPTASSLLTGLAVSLANVANGGAGGNPTVTFTVKDGSGNALPLSKLSSISLTMAGPTTQYGYTSFGSVVTTAGVATESVAGASCTSDGTCTYTFKHPVPANANGTYAIGVEARRTEVVLPGTTSQQSITYGAHNKVTYFSVDGSAVTPRRQVVATDSCNQCHVSLQVHGTLRNDTEYCVMCHNPSNTDASTRANAVVASDRTVPPQGINFNLMIHRIHTGVNLPADRPF